MGIVRWLWRITLAGALILALTAAAVVSAGYTAGDDGKAPASVRVIIVLGSGLRKNGNLTAASQNRIERAVALAGDRKDLWLICSGGLVYTSRRLSAGAAMRDWAIAHGFPADRVVAETRSRSTLENLVYSLPVAAGYGASPDDRSLMIVTDTTHAPRSRALAWVLGWGNIAVATSNTYTDVGRRAKVRWIVRETLAIWLNVGKVAAWTALGLAGLTPAERLDYVH